ncbi:MAG: hypothetical protein QW569_02675 [Candidatus Bathyarchaeia archaeon]
MPYGEVEISIEVADGSLVEILEPRLPVRINWIEKFKEILEGGMTIGLDPVLIGLGGENAVDELLEAVRRGVSEHRLKIVLAPNLYSMPIDIHGCAKKAGFGLEPWRGNEPPDIILAALLPHSLLGFCGAPHLVGLRCLELPSLLNNPDLAEWMEAGSLENNPITTSILEEVNSNLYAFHLIPYGGELIPISEGGLVDAFREGVKRYSESFTVRDGRPILVASVGGYPFDAAILNMIHTLRTMRRAVAEGGELILLSECGGVLADPSILRNLIGLTPREDKRPWIENLRRAISKVTNGISVRLVSTIPHSYARKMGFKPADTATAAFQSATRRIREAKASFITWGYHAVT